MWPIWPLIAESIAHLSVFVRSTADDFISYRIVSPMPIILHCIIDWPVICSFLLRQFEAQCGRCTFQSRIVRHGPIFLQTRTSKKTTERLVMPANNLLTRNCYKRPLLSDSVRVSDSAARLLYAVGHKTCYFTFVYIFANYWPIFKIFYCHILWTISNKVVVKYPTTL